MEPYLISGSQLQVMIDRNVEIGEAQGHRDEAYQNQPVGTPIKIDLDRVPQNGYGGNKTKNIIPTYLILKTEHLFN